MNEVLARLVNDACGRWDWLDAFMKFLDSGRPFFACMALVLLVPLAFTRGRPRGAWLTTLMAVGLTVLSATLAGRILAGSLPPQPRPLQVLDLHLPRHVPAHAMREAMLKGRPDTSLPSTHAITGSAVGLCLIWRRPRLGALATFLGGVLMIAPVLYFGTHWPSDIVVSLAIAALAGWLCGRPWPLLEQLGCRAEVVLQRWPKSSALGLALISLLVIWRVTPRLGVMDALTRAVRSLLRGDYSMPDSSDVLIVSLLAMGIFGFVGLCRRFRQMKAA